MCSIWKTLIVFKPNLLFTLGIEYEAMCSSVHLITLNYRQSYLFDNVKKIDELNRSKNGLLIELC